MEIKITKDNFEAEVVKAGRPVLVVVQVRADGAYETVVAAYVARSAYGTCAA